MDSEARATDTANSSAIPAPDHLCVVIYREGTRGLEGDSAQTKWIGEDGIARSLAINATQAEVVPEVKNGERIEWINLADVPFSIIFQKTRCPFFDGSCEFTVGPGRSVLSGIVRGDSNTSYSYTVTASTQDTGAGSSGAPKRGNPEVIVRGIFRPDNQIPPIGGRLRGNPEVIVK